MERDKMTYSWVRVQNFKIPELYSGQPFCFVEWNHLYNFSRRDHEEQFCEIIFIWATGS